MDTEVNTTLVAYHYTILGGDLEELFDDPYLTDEERFRLILWAVVMLCQAMDSDRLLKLLAK